MKKIKPKSKTKSKVKPKIKSKKQIKRNPDFLVELENLVRKNVEIRKDNEIFIGLLEYLPFLAHNYRVPRFKVKDNTQHHAIIFFPEMVNEIRYPDGYNFKGLNFGKTVTIVLI